MNNATVFDEIYRTRAWHYGSGTGSIAVFNQPFLRLANTFIASHPDIRTIVDIGCGDWQIGRHLALDGIRYIGADVSPYILERTQKRFASPQRQFMVLDATTGELPQGDLVIVKDVLQHLSNENVAIVLERLKAYRYAIVQNDIFEEESRNDEIPNGAWRVLDITAPPFRAAGYQRARTYTEGLLIPVNFIRSITGRKPIRKGIFIKDPDSSVSPAHRAQSGI